MQNSSLVFTQQDQSMSPDQLRVLVREVLMLSQDTTHRTTGHRLLLLMDTPPVTDVVASAVLSLATLVLVMVMDFLLMVTLLVVSALGSVSMPQAQSMSPDLHRVSVVDTCTRTVIILLCNMLEIN